MIVAPGGFPRARPVGSDLGIPLNSAPGIPYRWSLENTPTAITTARREVRHALEARHVPQDTIEVVELLTSEVVTNAVTHGRSAPCVELRVSDQQIRVTVEDDSRDRPEIRHVEPGALAGRGLTLVDRLAAFWGANPVPGGGKQVWFEVPFSYR